MKHDIATLPKWAQKRIADAERRANVAEDARRRMEVAHAVLLDREWFVINGQTPAESFPRKLWFLDKDHPLPVCSLAEGDVLLVGRKRWRANDE